MKNLILLVVCLCTLTGCTERNTERVYEEVVIKPEESVAAFTMDPHAGMQMPSAMTGVVSPDANVKWQVPNGWSEIAGGGMRIVSFRNVKEPEAIDVSIVSLSGPAGGLQANLIRWAGQIDLDLQEDSDKLRILTDASTPLKTNTGQSGSFYDYRVIQPRGDPSLKSVLAAVVTLNDQTIFIKMTGSQKAIDENLPAFKALAQSLESK